MLANKTAIVWFRQDLRIHDNPALYEAAKSKMPIIFLYILDEETKPWQLGAASKWWLHYSLKALNESLKKKYNASLILKKGSPLKILQDLIQETNAQSIYWNRCYEPQFIKRDKDIKTKLSKKIEVHSFNGALLKEPWEMLNQSKSPFKVFTPFWKTLQKQLIRPILSAPPHVTSANATSLTLKDLNLLPTIKWDKGLGDNWEPGETAALLKLKTFLNSGVKNYKVMRDHPSKPATSKLSPHIHFGELSPVQIWHAAFEKKDKMASFETDITHFLSELTWREFSTHLLYHFPDLPESPFKKQFEQFPWKNNKAHLQKWQQGITGYPIVDAGMRELWHTGWMHNRVRMIVASFLIKHLLQPWQVGELWFWDTLVDADLANNAASWQWVAGSGADAAPYFRIFNPVLQGEKFDQDGEYVRRWVPELKQLPSQYIHAPWEAPNEILQEANIILGKTYPHPIIDHKLGRKRALDAYQHIKS